MHCDKPRVNTYLLMSHATAETHRHVVGLVAYDFGVVDVYVFVHLGDPQRRIVWVNRGHDVGSFEEFQSFHLETHVIEAQIGVRVAVVSVESFVFRYEHR